MKILMSEEDLHRLLQQTSVSSWRVALARWVESSPVQNTVIGLILLNAVILGMETNPLWMERYGAVLKAVDKICLLLFSAELVLKWIAYRWHFWRSGWNIFDFVVVAIAIIPGTGPWSVLRSLRVLRVFRLLTAIPQLMMVVAAFLHAIPGLTGVIAVMLIFFYTSAVLATNLFGPTHPQWFGDLGKSLYSLFQVMTLESWSMGIVRPVMESHPWAWAFFVPFIVIATFTILNLFIGIIVSTMQELSGKNAPTTAQPNLDELLARMEKDWELLRELLKEQQSKRLP